MSSAGAVFLAIISVLFWLIGFGIYSQTKSAVHEIEVLASFIIAAILLVGAILASCITSLRGDLRGYLLSGPSGEPVPAEPIRFDATEPVAVPTPGQSLRTSVSSLLGRRQAGPAPKSAKEQLEELRAKERDRVTENGPGSPP
jgi:hypothetical protein